MPHQQPQQSPAPSQQSPLQSDQQSQSQSQSPPAQQAIMQGRLPNGQLCRPTAEDIHEGTEFIAKFREEWTKERNLDSVATHFIPENERLKLYEMLDQLAALVHDLDHKLPVMYGMMKRDKREELIKKLVIISVVTHYQHAQTSMTDPRFIIDCDNIRAMYTQSHNAHTAFTQTMAELAVMEHSAQPRSPASSTPS
ncbi:hypothetical protein DENSPDRAFT_932390 [Dentipellis sp. KUC8613]|nr:hypothetical protein DENSPDRAFT_932390 [Dentipellis sp. KUC8613]